MVAVERSTTLEGVVLHTPGSLSFRADKIELPDEGSQASRQGRTRERPKRAALSADSMAPASGWYKATIRGRTRGADRSGAWVPPERIRTFSMARRSATLSDLHLARLSALHSACHNKLKSTLP